MTDCRSVHRSRRRFLLSAVPVLFFLFSAVCAGQSARLRFKVVAIAEKGGLHQPFVDAAKTWLAREAQEGGFAVDYVDYIEDTQSLDDSFLSQYRLFIQLNYPPYRWTPAAMATFQRYIEEGRGGWIGFHHAT
jgi:uncharacterized protein